MIGAVAGGGIGGDQAIEAPAIAQQLLDIEAVEVLRLQQIQSAIEAANIRRERQADVDVELRRLRGEQERMVREVRSLLPGPQDVAERVELDQRRALMPLVDIFFDAFRPFLTEAYDNVANFRECFPHVEGGGRGNLTGQEVLLRNSFELLMKESIVQGISVPQTAITAFTQLLFGNNELRMLVSAAGSIVAFILARDALCLFSSTVISVMTFGTLSLEQLTNLCVFVYYNCSLVNLRNLLIYFNVPVANAQAFIQAIRNFNREQRQYIIMSLFLFGLNAIQHPGIVAEQVRDRINRLIEGARQYFPGDGGGRDPAAGDNDAAGLAAGQPANQAAAAQALNDVRAGIAPAAAVAAAPAQGQQNRSLLEIFGDQGIIAFINNILRNGWMRGLRITTSCLREVFRIYLPRQPHGQGLSFNLVDITGRIARWGVAAIRERSAVLDPAKPNQEVIQLLAAVNGMDLTRVINPAQCEAALYEFGRNLKGISVGPNNNDTQGAVRILQRNNEDGRLVYLTRDAAPGCLDALRAYFRPNDAATVNVERLQNACLGMRLFVFEQGMRSNILAAAVGRRVEAGHQEQGQDFNETQNAVQASESVQSMEQFVLEDNDTVTKNLFGRVRLMLQAFGIFQGEQLGRIGVVIQQILPDEEPSVNPAQILARERRAARMPHKEHVKTAVRASIVASGLPEEQKQLIIEHLMEFIDDMNFDEIQQYVLRADPDAAIPLTILESCRRFVDLPQRIQVLRENSAAVTAAVTAAVYSGLGRCAASLMNAAVVSSGAVADVARACIGRVSGLFRSVFGRDAAAAADDVVENVRVGAPPPAERAQDAAAIPGAAIIANIVLAQRIPEVEHGLVHSQNPYEGGRSRSRKRSASRGTRRKGKQSSKKLKHKSRRYVRRRRSTRRKN
jgi:hypothetical protein